MALTIDYVRSHEDIETCVDMYLMLNDPVFMPTLRLQCIRAFYNHISSGAYVRCLKEDNRIVAWLLARTGVSDFTGKKILQQIFYASDLTGVKAVSAVKYLHKDLMGYAERIKVYQIISNGSHMDSSNVFVRILGKMGWKVRGYSAVWYSSHDPFGMNSRE